MTAAQPTPDDCDPDWDDDDTDLPPDLRGQGLSRYARITDIPLAEEYL